MTDSLEQLCQEVNALEGHQLLLDVAKLDSLWQAAKGMTGTEPEQALRCLTILAVKSFGFPHTWNEKRKAILRDTISLIDTLQGKDYVFFLRFAEYCKQEGQYTAAGHNYKKAADARSRTGVSFLTYDPPLSQDPEEKFHLLREAMGCFQLGGDSQRASDCYIESQHILLNQAGGRKRLWMQLNWLVWGWGERPLRVVASGSVLIAVYAALYFFCGIKPPDASLIDKIINCIYFSVITFATVGYGDMQPASNVSKILAASEGLCGIFFTGLFLVTFVKRHAR